MLTYDVKTYERFLPNNDDPTHKDNYRAVIRRCNGPESPVFVYGEVLAFYQEK